MSQDDDQALKLKLNTDAMRLLSFRARSVEELKQRLAMKKRYTPAMIGEAIELFKKQGLLDDEKFAKLYTGNKMATRPSGKRQLEIELKQKGVSEKIVKKTMAEIADYDEAKAAFDLAWPRAQKSFDLPLQKQKARLYGFLKRRGFSDDAVYTAIGKIFKGMEHD